MSWREEALCKGQPTDWWFPKVGEIPHRALQICGECPVRLECAVEARENSELYGVWGGETGRLRRKDRGVELRRKLTARDRILEELRVAGSWVTAHDLAQRTGVSQAAISKALERMRDADMVVHDPRWQFWSLPKEVVS